MAKFSLAVSEQLLADAKRHCCLCHRRCGQRMQIHHIVPVANEGPGTYENGMPVCLDCHAEIESRSPMGRLFTPGELQRHRDRWFSIVRERPEIFLRSGQSDDVTGPLEALLAELAYNKVAVSGPMDQGFPPLATAQFQRSIATNALAALTSEGRRGVHELYASICRVNYFFDRLAHAQHPLLTSSASNAQRDLRKQLIVMIPSAIATLESALGRPNE